MRPSLRFLAVAVVGWAGVRAATLGVLPGAELFRVEPARATAPPITPTQFPPIQPVAEAQPDAYAPPYAQYYAPAAYPQPPVRPVMVPVYYAAPVSVPAASGQNTELPPPRRPQYYSSAADDWPLTGLAAISTPARSSVIFAQQSPPAPPAPPIDPHRLDRLQLTSWAYLRSQQTGIAGSRSLATGGQLGASQAGARLIYNFNRRLALAARFSSEVGRRGGEAAAGVRVQPLSGIPLWINAERRQALGRYGGGRNAFAFFAEGGLYERPLPWRFSFDSYLQGGVVGMRSRDWFVDGGMWATRPVYRNFSAGLGVWGAAQPGLYRVEAGPRLTVRVRGNIKAHVDWRQRLAGNARPGSGAALTLAADF
jgi:hypothetical protein